MLKIGCNQVLWKTHELRWNKCFGVFCLFFYLFFSLFMYTSCPTDLQKDISRIKHINMFIEAGKCETDQTLSVR